MANIQLKVEFSIEGLKLIGVYSGGMLIGAVEFEGDEASLKNVVPKSIASFVPNITVEDIMCILLQEKKFLFKIGLGNSFNLSDLPLIGKKIPDDLKIGIDKLALMFASETLKLPNGTQTFQKGVNVSADLQLGPKTIPLLLNAGSKPTAQDLKNANLGISQDTTSEEPPKTTATEPEAKTTPAAQKNNEEGMWINVNKNLGPAYFKRIGLKYGNSQLWFLLDASLSIGGVTLGMEGLAVGSSLEKFSPKFDLRGLSLFYSKGGITIGGALLRNKVTINGKSIDTYDGLVIIKTKTFSITALGSYCELNNQPSLFIYGFLGTPIGGPAFFFVTGIAAGFGLNRGLNIPPVENLLQFPFVGVVMGTQDLAKDPFTLLQSINSYVPPANGQYFLAFGIKFTSFKIVDSFALLTFGFGKKLTLDIIGISRLSVPPQVGNKATPVLAQVEMAFKVSYDFEEEALKVKAVLTSNSYILSRQCQLTGGFAFYSWFGGQYAGDFVCTLGGYHPSFKVPSHYPKVPRLGFRWKVSNNLMIKGGMYYALTSSACMAGGSLEATWSSGNFGAWFKIAADFLIAWKPYYYEASFSLSFGVKYTLKVNLGFLGKIKKTFKVSLSAGLKIWGPDFAGYAKLDLKVVSFKIRFGKQSKPALPPLQWDEFKKGFLPISATAKKVGNTYFNEICTLTITGGLIRKTEKKTNVVNPKEFAVVVDSAIPATATNIANAGEITQFGIGTMGLTTVASQLNVTITKGDKDYVKEFIFSPVRKNMPKALWAKATKKGVYRKPDLSSDLIPDLLAGFTIVPAPKDQPSSTSVKKLSAFSYDVEPKPESYDWTTDFKEAESAENIENTIETTDAVRLDLLSSLGVVSDDISLNGLNTVEGRKDAFLVTPESMTYS